MSAARGGQLALSREGLCCPRGGIVAEGDGDLGPQHREVFFFASQRKAATPEVMPRFITKPYIEQRGYGFLFTTPPPPRTTIPDQRHIYNKSII